MNVANYWQKDREALWHPYTRHSSVRRGPFPIIARGEGPYLFDVDGVRYLDAISSWWSCNLGHSHPVLTSAITRQSDELQHSILGGLSHPRAIELAAELVSLFPDDRRVCFSSDGSSAVEAALKIALQYWHNTGHPERNKFASLRNAYHGDTLGAVSVGFMEQFHKPFESVLFPVHRAESPCCALCTHSEDAATCDVECFKSMQAVFERHNSELAAVIVEPLCQGAAGMRIYSARYLQRLADLCREHNVLLIADEIATGMGRTGMMFAFEHAGITPDIVCVGKGLSGGYLPLSATIVSTKLFDAFADTPDDHTFYHGHTFAGNPIACAVGLATLGIYKNDEIVRGARSRGRVLAEGLAALTELPTVSGVRSLGMIGAMNVENVDLISRKLVTEHRILVRPLGNVLYLMLPLVATERLIRETVASIYAAVVDVGSE